MMFASVFSLGRRCLLSCHLRKMEVEARKLAGMGKVKRGKVEIGKVKRCKVVLGKVETEGAEVDVVNMETCKPEARRTKAETRTTLVCSLFF